MRERTKFQIFSHIILIIFSAFCLIPLLLLVASSFEENNTLIKYGYSFWPKNFSLEAYTYLFKHGDQIFRAYGVTILTTVVGTLINVILTTLMAFPLSRKNLPGRRVFNFLVFFTMLFNGGLVPTYLVYTNMIPVKNSILGVLIPNLLMGAYYVMLMKSFFINSIPEAVIEAGQVDGAGYFTILWDIVVPMAKPIIATVIMLVGITYWNDWYNGFIYITTKTQFYTIQALLNRMLQDIQYLSNNASTMSNAGSAMAQIPSTSVRMAISIVGLLPILIIYPFIQNSFVQGITLGAVKE